VSDRRVRDPGTSCGDRPTAPARTDTCDGNGNCQPNSEARLRHQLEPRSTSIRTSTVSSGDLLAQRAGLPVLQTAGRTPASTTTRSSRHWSDQDGQMQIPAVHHGPPAGPRLRREDVDVNDASAWTNCPLRARSCPAHSLGDIIDGVTSSRGPTTRGTSTVDCGASKNAAGGLPNGLGYNCSQRGRGIGQRAA
jgi:hypothetical protein